MDIKDLAGLSEPLTKLIEVVSKGLGNVSRPYLIKKTADAKAYEIERISKALEENKQTSKLIEYDDEKIRLVCEEQEISEDSIQEFKDIAERAEKRIFHREIKKQINVESVVAEAAEALKDESNVSKEELNDDWITRYFNIVEDVSNEEMQNLWGRILAGEIKKPNTYSLRAMDILRNITPAEAEVFCKVGAYALTSGDKSFLLQDKKFLEDELNINFTDLMLVRNLGLMFPTELEFSFSPSDKNDVSFLQWGDRIIVAKRKESTPKIPINSNVFTRSGVELLNLVDKPHNEKYLKQLCTKIRINDNVQTYYANIIAFEGGNILHDNLVEVT